jgi:hypothetical protein
MVESRLAAVEINWFRKLKAFNDLEAGDALGFVD